MILKDYKNSVFNVSHHRPWKVINQDSDFQNTTTFRQFQSVQNLSLFEDSHHLIRGHSDATQARFDLTLIFV